MKVILISKSNPASTNIGKYIRDNWTWEEAGEFDGNPSYTLKDHSNVRLVYAEKNVLDLDYLETPLKALNPEVVVVASTHRSKAGVKTLTTHVPGNWTSADFGGKKETVSIAPSLYLRQALLNLKKNMCEGYAVSLEATHHGPSIDVPIMFMEVGSSEKEWGYVPAVEAVGKSILETILSEPEKVPSCLGIGGTHYAPSFTRVILSAEYEKIAFGHIIPKYASSAPEEVVLRAIERTKPKLDYVVIDWKGVNSELKQKVKSLCERENIKWKKLSDFKIK